MKVVRRTAAAVLLSSLLVLLMVGPAAAHHKDGHDQAAGQGQGTQKADERGKARDNDGDADDDPSTSHTEDSDTNDGGTPNNVADDGDNAHPSGKDRSVESGKSGNQGNAESDPDDDGRGPDRTNRGPDKPNGSGGADLADQDGNNGCGNDDDFEDDNEGHCRGRRKPKPEGPAVQPEPPKPCDLEPGMPGIQPCVQDDDDDDVGGKIIRPARPEVISPVGGPDVVLGTAISRAAPDTTAGGALPLTGGTSITSFAAVGALLIATGMLLMRKRRITQ